MILIGYGGVCAFVLGLMYWRIRRRRNSKKNDGLLPSNLVDVEVGEGDPLKRD